MGTRALYSELDGMRRYQVRRPAVGLPGEVSNNSGKGVILDGTVTNRLMH